MHHTCARGSRASSRGFISLGIILALIIAAIVIGGGAYYAGSRSPGAQPYVPQDQATSTPGSDQAANNLGQPADTASCAAFAALKKGDTDASTGGQVTKLQQFLGISPTTGSYGALTSIGYTNKCVGGNAAPTSVAGMSKYTDSNFGFSFWYPSTWLVQEDDIQYQSPDAPAVSARQLTISSSKISVDYIQILEISPPTASIIDASGGGLNRTCPTTACATVKYFFDSIAGQWKMVHPDEATNVPAGVVQATDVSHNTMGGLHIFAGSARFGNDSIVPLSATKFLQITGSIPTNNIDQKYLVQTIVATDPTVAIPVATAEQTATVQAEAQAYGSSDATDSFGASPLSGSAPLEVTFSPISTTFGQDSIDFGDYHSSGLNGYCSPNNCSIRHTYTSPGTYKAHILQSNPTQGADTVLATLTITVY